MKNTWFSSDWHLMHYNVIRYDNRPFKSVEEMNDTIVNNYNNLVSDEDDFYFLGDLYLGNARPVTNYLSYMKGNKFFIKGNHDKKDTIKLYEKFGTYLGEQSLIYINGQKIILNHYGMRVWQGSHKGNWHLYGHSHGNLPPHNKSFDVGVMNWGYKPISFEQVKEKMETLTYKPVDHHG